MALLHHRLLVPLLSAVLILGAGCQAPGPNGSTNNTATGALGGGALGALAGGIIGNMSHNSAEGALIGALVGALAGGLVGHSMDQAQRQWLRTHAPQTLGKIDHNASLTKHAAITVAQAPPPLVQPIPPQAAQLSGSDLKALADAGVNPVVVASQEQPVPEAPASPQVIPLNITDIVALAQSGMKDDVIVTQIRESRARFNQSDIAILQRNGVSHNVVDYIRDNATA